MACHWTPSGLHTCPYDSTVHHFQLFILLHHILSIRLLHIIIIPVYCAFSHFTADEGPRIKTSCIYWCWNCYKKLTNRSQYTRYVAMSIYIICTLSPSMSIEWVVTGNTQLCGALQLRVKWVGSNCLVSGNSLWSGIRRQSHASI